MNFKLEEIYNELEYNYKHLSFDYPPNNVRLMQI